MWAFIKEFYHDSLFDLGKLAMLQKYWWLYAIPVVIIAIMIAWSLWKGRAS